MKRNRVTAKSAGTGQKERYTAGTGKRQTGKKRSAAERKELEARERFMKNEAAFIFVCFFALFLFLSNFGLLGKLGSFFGGLQRGLFGYGAYGFPLVLVLLVLFCIREKKDAVYRMKIGCAFILAVCVCTMLHLAFGAGNAHSFSAYFEAGRNGELNGMAAGGALGGAVADGLVSLIANAGAWLLVTALSILSFVVITEKSFINAARSGAEGISKTARAGSVYAKQKFEAEKERLEIKREEAEARRKEFEAEKSLRNSEAQVLPPGSSVFDLKSERTRNLSPFGDGLVQDRSLNEQQKNSVPDNSETERTVDLKAKTEKETAISSGDIRSIEGNQETAAREEIQKPDYDSDAVPFEETANERYRAYGRMLSSGKIGMDAAREMGFAVSSSKQSNGQTTAGQYRPLKYEASASAAAAAPSLSAAASPLESSLAEDLFLPEAEDPADRKMPEYQEDCGVFCTEEDYMDPRQSGAEEVIEPSEYQTVPAGYGFSETAGISADTACPAPEKKSTDTVPPDYDQLFHITDEDRDEVYNERKKAAARDTAYTPFSDTGSVPACGDRAGLIKKTQSSYGEPEQKNPTETMLTAEHTEKRPYQFPPVGLLKKGSRSAADNQSETRENARKLEKVLSEFGVGVTVTNVVKGPRVTRYEMTPDVGVKVSRITSLSGDIKLAMAASELRIEAPIPGKSAVGIEVPNTVSDTVTFRDIMETESFRKAKSGLSWGVGLDIQGEPVVGDIAKMPHLLVSGTTGSGKSVGINSIIMSVIYRSSPEDVKMILVDPKVVELSVYDGIPHLLAPVVTKPEQALAVLNKACAEMAHRYTLFKDSNTRNIIGYNAKVEEICAALPEDVPKPEKLPYILIIIDELSELMMHSKKDVESAIVSLTQLARAAGIHLVVATQRPSVDVVTGLIKSNIPSRVAYKLPSGIDSRTVLDTYGAENLLGNGDMLYKPGNLNNPLRVQGAYLSDQEVEEVVEWLKKHNQADYDGEWQNLKAKTETGNDSAGNDSRETEEDGRDEYFFEAGVLITEKKKASIGLLQRKFKIGFNRASRIMEQLCEAGVVSEGEGTKERQILMETEEFKGRF